MSAAALVAGFGCTQTQTTKKNTAYYHDHRRVPLGSNVPKSYHDTDDGRQSEMERENFQRMQNTMGSGTGGQVGGGATR